MHPSPVHAEVAPANVAQSIGKQAKVFKVFCIGRSLLGLKKCNFVPATFRGETGGQTTIWAHL
ncbi:hypothetical protein EMIT043CA1_80089 [Pseudomonas brassicacearum]